MLTLCASAIPFTSERVGTIQLELDRIDKLHLISANSSQAAAANYAKVVLAFIVPDSNKKLFCIAYVGLVNENAIKWPSVGSFMDTINQAKRLKVASSTAIPSIGIAKGRRNMSLFMSFGLVVLINEQLNCANLSNGAVYFVYLFRSTPGKWLHSAKSTHITSQQTEGLQWVSR